MKRCQFLLFGLLLATPALGERGIRPQRAGLNTPMGEYHLLVIGIDDYVHWPKLKCAVRDAKAVRDVLVGEYGFDGSRVTEFYNTGATERNIKGAIRKLGQELTKEDSLLIYYAGHGQLDSFTKEGAWIPVEGDRENDSNWIRCGLIKSYLRHLPARHVLLVSDSCFAGDFFRGSRGAPPEITDAYVREAFKKSSRQAITSGGLEPVADAGFDNHSVFAHFLLKELRENRSPFLLPSDLHDRIKGGVAENANQTPILGTLQDTGGEVGGEFVLFRKGTGGTMEALLKRKAERLEQLQAMEAEARKAEEEARKLEAEKQEALDVLDTKISALEARVEAGDARGGTLKELLVLARQQEQQTKALLELKRKKAAEEAARRAEVARLKKTEEEKRKETFEEDYADYRDIASNRYVKPEIKQKAWEAICTAWRVEECDDQRGAQGTQKGPPRALRWNTKLDRPELVSYGALLVWSKEAGKVRLGKDPWSELNAEENLCWVSLPVGSYLVEAEIGGRHWSRLVAVLEDRTTELGIGSAPPLGEVCSIDLGGGVKLEMVLVPKGSFLMGSPSSEWFRDDDETQHSVMLTRDFWIGKYEVTQRQWQQVMGSNPSHFIEPGLDAPMEQVSWNDCQEFIKLINAKVQGGGFRLPTEAEWEYASRAGTTVRCSGYRMHLGWFESNSHGSTHTVGMKEPNPWDLYDMHGNVYEWCGDWYGSYPSGSVADPVGPRSGSDRVFRGGSWAFPENRGRRAERLATSPSNRRHDLGFRLVRTAQ